MRTARERLHREGTGGWVAEATGWASALLMVGYCYRGWWTLPSDQAHGCIMRRDQPCCSWICGEKSLACLLHAVSDEQVSKQSAEAMFFWCRGKFARRNLPLRRDISILFSEIRQTSQYSRIQQTLRWARAAITIGWHHAYLPSRDGRFDC